MSTGFKQQPTEDTEKTQNNDNIDNQKYGHKDTEDK